VETSSGWWNPWRETAHPLPLGSLRCLQHRYMIPQRTELSWDPRLEPLDLAEKYGVAMPRLGYVSAGWPVETPEEHETIRVPSRMTRKASYTMRVRGHSMTNDQIQDGDIIIIEQRQTAANSETVAALINGEKVTLKRFFYRGPGGSPTTGQPRHGAPLPAPLRRSRFWVASRGWCA
jgi:repressor LexA